MQDAAALAIKMGETCPAMRVRAASRMLARLYDEAFREIGLEVPQLALLAALATQRDSGFKVTEIARALVIDRTSVTRAIRPLEKAGLLRVARSPNDARSKIVVITRAGERMLRDAYPRWERTTKRIRKVFGPARLDVLSAELEALVAAGPALARSSKRGSTRLRSRAVVAQIEG
jgi:DNA-binding MarR family transcriptional regulator